jgi:hypothetical protein
LSSRAVRERKINWFWPGFPAWPGKPRELLLTGKIRQTSQSGQTKAGRKVFLEIPAAPAGAASQFWALVFGFSGSLGRHILTGLASRSFWPALFLPKGKLSDLKMSDKQFSKFISLIF